jgi:hypothetical protein
MFELLAFVIPFVILGQQFLDVIFVLFCVLIVEKPVHVEPIFIAMETHSISPVVVSNLNIPN